MSIDPRLIFLRGQHVWLKALSEHDIAESDWVGWFNDADLCSYNQHHYFPNTVEKQRQYLAANRDDRLLLGVVDRRNADSICGVVSLTNIHPIHRCAEIAAMLDKTRTGANPAIFMEAYSLLIRHGFEELGLQKICSGTFRPLVAEALVKAFNFVIEGKQRRQVFKHNRFHDVTLLALFADDVRYPALPALPATDSAAS